MSDKHTKDQSSVTLNQTDQSNDEETILEEKNKKKSRYKTRNRSISRQSNKKKHT